MTALPTNDLTGVKVDLIEHSDEIDDFKRWLGERRANGVLAFDLETTGLSPYEQGAGIRLAQVGDGMRGWAVPWDMWPGLIIETLSEYEGDIVGHNIGFDIKWMEHFSKWRAPWSQIHDTMIAARLTNPLAPAGLKPLSDKYIDRRASVGQKMLDDAFTEHGWSWATVPVDYAPYWQYAALDTVLTARLHEIFQDVVGPGMPYSEAYDLEMAVLRIVTRMEQRGARIDIEYSQSMFDKCHHYSEEMREWARSRYGVNIGSPTQLVRAFRSMDAEIVATTPSGSPKIDKYQLKLFIDPDNGYPKDVRDLADATLRHRKYGKLASSYFGNFVSQSVDGIVHASINPMAARTGRMSISAPALQQLPRNDATVRSAFIPRDGNSLISTDFSQIEMRMLAHFSSDAELQHAFSDADESGGDFFVNIGREVYRDPDFQKKDKRRGLIKNSMYGLAYGAGPAKMAESAGVPVDRMKDVVDALTTRYPGIKRFMAQVEDVGKRREMETGQGFIEGIDGRRLPCDSGRVYTLVNYLIQGGAAVAFKRALIRLDEAGYGDYFLLPVHDEILVDIPSGMAGEAMDVIPKVMCDTSFSVTIPADADGPFHHSWGEKYS